MTSPISSGSSFYQAQTTPALEKPISQEKSEKASLQNQFNALKENYNKMIDVTDGCGNRMQKYLDEQYDILVKFATEHPEFKAQLPRKWICPDDETSGMRTAIATMAADARRSGEDCSIM